MRHGASCRRFEVPRAPAQTRVGTSNRKAARDLKLANAPLLPKFVSEVLQRMTNFGSGALVCLRRFERRLNAFSGQSLCRLGYRHVHLRGLAPRSPDLRGPRSAIELEVRLVGSVGVEPTSPDLKGRRSAGWATNPKASRRRAAPVCA